MGLINGIPLVDPTVKYDGKTLPQDAAPLGEPPIDENVFYAGKQLPSQKTPIQIFGVDPTNDPSSIAIGGIFLPASTQIMVKGEKILAESQIIDGVSVFEHISRKPYEIDFDITIWQGDGSNQASTKFPQQQINDIFSLIWLPNSVQKVQNTYLNGLNIQQIIVKSVSPQPKLGSTNVVIRIKCYENQPGETIIL